SLKKRLIRYVPAIINKSQKGFMKGKMAHDIPRNIPDAITVLKRRFRFFSRAG
ncbi:Hypothetical protein FKW44_013713, partial [Caligus rogercresseyi]